jgi:ribonucleoside-diphosphate reductase alpha chain
MGSHGIRVIRCDGFDHQLKYRQNCDVVEWACEGKKVNSIALEAGLTTRLRMGLPLGKYRRNLN